MHLQALFRIGASGVVRRYMQANCWLQELRWTPSLQNDVTKSKLATVHEHARAALIATSALLEEAGALLEEAEALRARVTQVELAQLQVSKAAAEIPREPAPADVAAVAELTELQQHSQRLEAELREARGMQQGTHADAHSRKEQLQEERAAAGGKSSCRSSCSSCL